MDSNKRKQIINLSKDINISINTINSSSKRSSFNINNNCIREVINFLNLKDIILIRGINRQISIITNSSRISEQIKQLKKYVFLRNKDSFYEALLNPWNNITYSELVQYFTLIYLNKRTKEISFINNSLNDDYSLFRKSLTDLIFDNLFNYYIFYYLYTNKTIKEIIFKNIDFRQINNIEFIQNMAAYSFSYIRVLRIIGCKNIPKYLLTNMIKIPKLNINQSLIDDTITIANDKDNDFQTLSNIFMLNNTWEDLELEQCDIQNSLVRYFTNKNCKLKTLDIKNENFIKPEFLNAILNNNSLISLSISNHKFGIDSLNQLIDIINNNTTQLNKIILKKHNFSFDSWVKLSTLKSEKYILIEENYLKFSIENNISSFFFHYGIPNDFYDHVFADFISTYSKDVIHKYIKRSKKITIRNATEIVLSSQKLSENDIVLLD